MLTVNLAAIPSPTTAVWHLGPFPVRAYALCIVAGIVIACVVTEARLRRRGVAPWAVLDVAVWAVPFGVVGARVYHVLTSWTDYFGYNGDPVKALYIWEGGLGIWGAVAGGAVGAWLGCRQIGLPLRVFADALAPGLPLAQAAGRFGNWFNNELHGGPTTLPWGLEVHVMDRVNPGRALLGPDGGALTLPGLYHPTFLYEALWNVGVAVLVIAAERRFRLGRGRAFALYVAGYTVGRFWIELMRTDPAPELLGLRFNVWTSLVVFLGAVAYLVLVCGPAEYVLPAANGGYRVVDAAAYRAAADAAPAADAGAPAAAVPAGSARPDEVVDEADDRPDEPR
ncbi:prolipoprotein diacylglyceryl transferase [Pilimelia anulata]|uniref:Phosphatidylglycerol--prolipoprotein diacylglyceryl transferase n=1 Tax=Pilimelia anulata TaxID=53371 RepID=A0A8J3B0X9_9ACTN|nr:prolipoprotein diacylglyceryl transferase [Pilimelia anulata]